VAIALDADGDMIGQPAIRTQGVPVEEDKEAFLVEAGEAAQDAVVEGFSDLEKLRERIRLAVRRVATRWTGKKPVVDVLLIAQ
jgi:ribonuclease J